MGAALEFEKEKLIIGFIYSTDENYERALKIMTDRFGPVDFETEEFSFTNEFSDYYDEELGGEAVLEVASCENCGLCLAACPTGILRGEGDVCLSALTQKKGELNEDTVELADGADAVCVFVNDTVNAAVIDRLCELGKFGDELYLYAGNDSQIFATLSLFGKGVISVVSNIYPDCRKSRRDFFQRQSRKMAGS